ncbi:MAG: PrsW family intramembrane metalloprotease [Deltaproteobacteria bacterium]|nr:PrsW family intramembrane metalloprotease [Deltaproteobacteria bacterium]
MIFPISVAASLLPITVYILFLRWLDRYEREPFGHILMTFFLGATVSIGFSFAANTVVGIIGHSIMTEAGSTYFLAGLVAPVVEETNKGIMIVLFAWFSREFDNITDGLLYGAVVGLGFAFSENVLYFIRVYHESGQFAWIRNMYVRSFFTAGVHAAATGVFGGCLAYARHSKWSERTVAAAMGWGLAVMIHSFWNSVLTASDLSNDPVLAVLPFFCLPVLFFVLFLLFQVSLLRESRMIGEELTVEAMGGTLPMEHVAILKSYLRRDKSGWFQNELLRERYVEQATHLAFIRNEYRQLPEKKRGSCERKLNAVREEVKRLLASEKGGLAGAILAVLSFVLFFVGVVVFGFWIWGRLLVDFPAYALAKTYLSNHSKILELIGPVEKWDQSPSGEFLYNNEEGGEGKLEMDLAGQKGKGSVKIDFFSDFGQTWKIDHAVLAVPGQKEPIELEGPDQWLDKAYGYMDQRKYVEAQSVCELIQKSTPDDDRADSCLAELALAQGDPQKAVEIRKLLADKYPGYDSYETRLAYAYYAAGDGEKSIEHYRKAWDLSADPETASSIAYVYLDSGKTDEAWEWLTRAREKELHSAMLAYRFGWYYYNKKDAKAAEEYFNLSRDEDPSYAMPFFGLAYLSLDAGKDDDAIYYFEEGIQRSPNNSLTYRHDLVDLLVKNKYFDEAIFHLIRTTLYHPQSVGPFVLLAKLYERQGRAESARIIYDQALKLEPTEAEKWNQEYNYLLQQ